MRPIDADALDARMYYEAFEKDSADQRWDSGCWIRYKLFEKVLKEAPTVEPERETGKWLPHKEINREYMGSDLVSVRYDYWFCDMCGYRVEEAQTMYKFCPHCGAKMEV